MNKLDIIIDACEDVKAQEIINIPLEGKTDIADNFIIASANTVNQTKAIARRVDEKMSKAGFIDNRREGFTEGTWIILDYQDVVVHIFTNERRQYYNLERLWS